MTDQSSRLYLALGRIHRALRQDAPEVPVGLSGLSTLATLVAQGPMRLGSLTAIEGVTAPSMTRIVASLEEFGHVQRHPDPSDGRAFLVDATPSGMELVATGRSQRCLALGKRIDRLSPTQQRHLFEALPLLEALAQD